MVEPRDSPRCFIIQPFDGARFDKRYEDHFKPAIEAAGFVPYRVDRDPSVRVPIESIHEKIRSSQACLVDITTNNPNVWYELGYALANKTEMVLVCSSERTEDFPFDIRHLNIIRYRVESGSDFENLELRITEQLSERISERNTIKRLSELPSSRDVEDLKAHEVAVLTYVMAARDYPGKLVMGWVLNQSMAQAGFSDIGTNLGAESLSRKGMIEIKSFYDHERDEPYHGYEITEKGVDWLLEHLGSVELTR